MSIAYEQGKSDKEQNILEPIPPYEPGTKAYADYVDGYLHTPWPEYDYNENNELE